MPDVYYPVLGAAMALAVGAVVCLVSARLSSSSHLFRLGQVGSVCTLVALAIAVFSHVRIGHTPGTDTALPFLGFVAAHPMVFVVAAASIGLLTWAQLSTLRK